MHYRREIDGLRAVAVIPVVAFHAGLSALPGGYIGVDVFFVISGFLITSTILDGVSRGTFTFAAFYERRARRILPALFAMLGACFVVAWLVLLPVPFRHFGLSAAAVALFSSNFYFLRTTDYFAAPSELVPLIHTWSLGVEEQFYLLFPVLAVLVAARRRATLLICGLLLISLGLAHWSAPLRPATAFYLLPTRAWELLAGSLVAYVTPHLPGAARRCRGVLALAGLASVTSSYVLFDRSTPAPSLYTALPVAGTALVLSFATAETRVGRLLGWAPLTFIGLISYSTYLWHQPLFAFARHVSLNEPSASVFALLALASFVLGALSWRYIEQPFRDRSWLTQRQVFGLAAACSGVLIAAGGTIALKDGVRSRLDATVLAYADTKHATDGLVCGRPPPGLAGGDDACILGDARNIVGALVGDSHAIALAQGLSRTLAAQGLGLVHLAHDGCPPLPDVARREAPALPDCATLNEAVHARLHATRALKHIVIAARWTHFLVPGGFDNGEGGVEFLTDRVEHLAHGARLNMPEAARSALIADKTTTLVRGLLDHGKHVVLVYPIPEVGWHVPHYLARRAWLRRWQEAGPAPASTSLARFHARNRPAFQMLDALGDIARLSRIYPHRALCGTPLHDRCILEDDKGALYYDDNHVGLAGALLIAPDIVRALTQAAP